MSEYAAALERVRRRAGVERGFTDYRGQWHALADADLARLLETLGHDARDAATLHAAADQLEALEWTRVLPPVVVLREQEEHAAHPVMIAPVPPRIRWYIDQEDGTQLTGCIEPSACPLTAEQERDGLWYQRRRLALPALPAGYHRLTLEMEQGNPLGSALLIVAPARCHLPGFLAQGERCWGLGVQLYTLRSPRNWGIGDFTDLAGIAAAAAGLGADLLGLNPLHALFPEDPGRASPYSPSSRLFLNALYIDPEAVPEFAVAGPVQRLVSSKDFQDELVRLRRLEHVDYAGVTACKFAVLRLLFRWFEDNAAPSRRQACDHFVACAGASLQRFARHHAAHAAAAPASEAAEIRFHCWLQWVARAQLESAANAAREAGMRIGLYLDLAVGPDATGAEAGAGDQVLASKVSVGAPPDPLAPQGQDWGIPPFHPQRLREQGYAPFIRLLRANMPQGGAVRIDHVMALMRLWWIPHGRPSAAGGYVHYRLDELMAIVALESHTRRCLVVGEDLGTVPDEVRAAMEQNGVLSYRVLLFEREGDGAFRAPADYPQLSLVTPTTHDLPTLAGYWRGDDLVLRAALGLYADDRVPAHELDEREAARRALAEALGAAGGAADSASVDAIIDGAQLYVARSCAAILMLQAEDWLRETRPVNVPGTHQSYPNWRRKLAADWPEFMASDRVRAFAARVNAARRGAKESKKEL
ncbi:4-alpha-glucanotransferase [Thioalkalivibrio sp. XN279]|uniref:4-alpha-glucanotransferase n=1 Tax=Thioalkalivibrio sp. XN279 TaxID=2714953 RepID=UPI00140DBF87|nr:4-alpha-glucanotransferase [Thioalkalivibrio sp. XN279]NHA14470.1 4-alpha-glucanotransferase [Thioalkalivibrio sp. XN279]